MEWKYQQIIQSDQTFKSLTGLLWSRSVEYHGKFQTMILKIGMDQCWVLNRLHIWYSFIVSINATILINMN